MLKTVFFVAHHRHKWQYFRIRLVDKVMKIDFSYDFAIANNPKLFEEKFIQKIIDFAKEFNIELKDSNKDFNDYLKNFCESAQERSLVLLIDEYDYHLSQNIENPQLFSDYAAVLRIFYSVLKNQLSKFRCIFITGITRYKDSSIFTAGNTIADKSQSVEFGAITGYTKEEIKTYFKDNLIDAVATRNSIKHEDVTSKDIDALLEEMAYWYDGYCFDSSYKTHVFSTWSVIQFFLDAEFKFKKYWLTSGGNPTILQKSMEKVVKNSENLVNHPPLKATLLKRGLHSLVD